MQEQDVYVIGLEPAETGFSGRTQKSVRKVLRQFRLSDPGNNGAPATTLTYQVSKDALERSRQSHPCREMLSCFGRDGDALAPVPERRAQDALAFALAVDVRGVKEANALLKSGLYEARGLGWIASENRAKPCAAKSESLLGNVKTSRTVHVVEPELPVRIVPFSAEARVKSPSLLELCRGSIACHLNRPLR
jgi:hypothetical protein